MKFYNSNLNYVENQYQSLTILFHSNVTNPNFYDNKNLSNSKLYKSKLNKTISILYIWIKIEKIGCASTNN